MAPPPKHRRFRAPPKPPNLYRVLKFTALLSILTFLSLNATTLLLPRANTLGRTCHRAPHVGRTQKLRMAIVSLSDEGSGVEGPRQGAFKGLMALVRFNKELYAKRWGYHYIDCGDCLDTERPASWSKILAVRRFLNGYDWVFWNDADSIVTNPNISLESILQSVVGQSDLTTSPDLVVTEDVNGINAGMWFMRNSRWSEAFLDTWWNRTDFIQFGSARSGDNAALIHIIGSMSPWERHMHVHVADAQCLFNSYPWIPTWKNVHRLITSPISIWRGVYSDGDFMVHLAGLDNKKEWTAKILHDVEENNSPMSRPLFI